MKRKTILIISVITIMAMMCTLFVACGPRHGQTPVYQGMSISRNDSSAMSDVLGDGTLEDIVEDIIDGDYDGRDDDIDEDDPFEDGDDEDIEEEIKGSLEVTGAVDDIYYATRNEDIFITIHIDNPDSYEIMSFTLNGKKYTS